MVTTDVAHKSSCLVHKTSGYVSAVRFTQSVSCSVCKYSPWFGYADSADGLLIFGTKILVHGTKSFWGAVNLWSTLWPRTLSNIYLPKIKSCLGVAWLFCRSLNFFALQFFPTFLKFCNRCVSTVHIAWFQDFAGFFLWKWKYSAIYLRLTYLLHGAESFLRS